MSSIRENKEKGEVEVRWTSGDRQLADCLTKKGASPHALLRVLEDGRIEA